MKRDLRICPQCSNKARSDYIRFFINKFINEINLDNRIIDLGCGRGRNLYYLNNLGFKNLTAIDLFKFKELNTNKINFINADLNKSIPIYNRKFDIILCNYLLMFINNKDRLISEINRISNQNCFCIVELNPKKLTNGFDYKFSALINYFCDWDILNIRLKENKFILKKR
jgi:ubiquinone/menaquinone biosynthesis C-methylase UbiE